MPDSSDCVLHNVEQPPVCEHGLTQDALNKARLSQGVRSSMHCCCAYVCCRAVLASFRARHVRQEGLAVFNLWRDWAHWRTLERRAIVAHWHKLMLLVSRVHPCWQHTH